MSFIERALESVGIIKPATTLSPIQAGAGNQLFDAAGGVIAVFQVYGALQRFEGEQREEKLKEFESFIATWNSQPGYYLTFIHEHSEEGLENQVERSHKPMRQTMQRIGMPAGQHLLKSREQMLSGQLHFDCLYLVLHTTTGVLPTQERKPSTTTRWGFPGGQGGNYFDKLHDLHHSFEQQITSALSRLSIQYKALSARESAALTSTMWSRREMNPNAIRLVGDHVARYADTIGYRKTKDGDYTPTFRLGDLAYPKLSEQIFTDKIFFSADRDDHCLINGYYQAALRMTQAPGSGTLRKYNDLRSRLSVNTNYRLAIQLTSGMNGQSGLAIKRMLSLALSVTNPRNLDIAKSVEEIDELEKQGVASAGVRLMVATWARDARTLERNLDKLHHAFQSWGGQDNGGSRLVTITDNPDDGVAATLPGAIMRGGMTFMPIGLISDILPIEMSTSPWGQGLIMRSGEDQAYPMDPGDDALLDFHVYVLIGGMGKGKSVTMTELVKSVLFRGGMEKLPYVRYLDVGYTSKALFSYLRYMLPEERRHEIVHYTIQNTREYALNPFDAPLGMREPPAQEMSFLQDAVGSYLSNGADGLAASALEKLGSMLVREAFRMTSDDGKMVKLYYQPEQADLVEAIKRHNITAKVSETPWYSVVDALFDAGEIRMAHKAQRYASPRLSDLLPAASRSTSIQETFANKKIEGTDVLSYAQTTLTSMVERYPMLSEVTQLDIEGARMVGIDMQDVANNAEETNLMYMMLQNVLSRGFMSDPDAIARMDMPERYRSYHRERIRELRNSDKLFSFDELHRLSVGLDPQAPIPKAMMLLMRWIKEVRKYGIRLMLSTQSIEHMPAEIRAEGMWSLFFCMGVDTIPAQNKLADLFDVSEYGQAVLRQLHGPIPGKGARCLFMANTKHGKIEQDLYITTSPFELWAAPTKASNLELMNDVLQRLGDPIMTARALTKLFPKGSAESELDRLVDHDSMTKSEAKAMIVDRVIDEARSIMKEAPQEA